MITHPCRSAGWPCGQYREQARWTGEGTGHCSNCGHLFTSDDAFTRHQTHGGDGRLVCRDPGTARRRDGEPMFEPVFKPKWEPSIAWRTYKPGRKRWEGPETS
jgi:hypothetical protein